ncbi:YfhD family protein [Alkalihalophilus pseudofirmus]|uniref:YfhD family protein n=1 Tax=Alkalihalophilus pseudofirmus TaxID=79885 RepID=A0AAJ2U450_ALKPS|nr:MULTISPECIES: YfhD family protein [Alkalihalophilus]MDV2886827.1 YfhD family protein [Alkalihalophilus pseudofirmus]MED1600560.1 YfhD family protein [Alkalihalophilus marmarensis]WEG17568.1 YfhD family protein [Alkalihalophilus pseudofirmus]
MNKNPNQKQKQQNSQENMQYQGPYDEVEFSKEFADSEDQEAMARMKEADARASQKKK